jgi:hypothetical protein
MARNHKEATLKPEVQLDDSEKFMKSHLDSVCQDAQFESVANAREAMQLSVIQTKVLKGIGANVSQEMTEYMRDTIQNALGQISGAKGQSEAVGSVNNYLDYWDLQKKHLGIEHWDVVAPGALRVEMQKRLAPLI